MIKFITSIVAIVIGGYILALIEHSLFQDSPKTKSSNSSRNDVKNSGDGETNIPSGTYSNVSELKTEDGKNISTSKMTVEGESN